MTPFCSLAADRQHDQEPLASLTERYKTRSL